MAGTVITNKGVALIAKLLASGQELIFTRAAVGTGRLPGGFSPQNMTGLVEYKKDGDIAACSSSGDIASVIFQISSSGVTKGFTVTEVGLFATDPDDGEILYSYMDLSEDPQYIYAEGGAVSKFAEIELQTVIGQLEKVTAYINPGSLLTNDGDISNTEIGALDVITESFPIPAAKEKSRKFFGKVKKSMEDWKNLKTGLITTGKLINNGLCTEAGFALDARFGKNLQDQITTQNNNLAMKIATGKNCTIYYNQSIACIVFSATNVVLTQGENNIDIFALPSGWSVVYQAWFSTIVMSINWYPTGGTAYIILENKYGSNLALRCSQSYAGGVISFSTTVPRNFFNIP